MASLTEELGFKIYFMIYFNQFKFKNYSSVKYVYLLNKMFLFLGLYLILTVWNLPSELRSSLSVKCIADFEDLVQKNVKYLSLVI